MRGGRGGGVRQKETAPMVQSAVIERQAEPVVGRGAQTRQRVLDIAEAGALAKGFAATSIDEVIFEAGLSKSGFFHHFRDKNDLARALVERFQARDGAILDGLEAQADALSEDPLHSFLIFLKLFADTMNDLENGHPGCLVSTFVYQDQQYDPAVHALITETLVEWRARFRRRLDRIAAAQPPRVDIDPDTLANMLTVVVDGGIILSRGLRSGKLLGDQIMAYRTFVRLIFTGA